MSRQSRTLAGILLVVVPTVMFGGLTLLSFLTRGASGYVDNPLRHDLWRAGHMHAGVLMVAKDMTSKTEPIWPWPDSLDALSAAPASHRLLFENEKVRVLEVIIPAGHKEPWHTHQRPSLMLIDQSASIRYFRSDDDFDEHPRKTTRVGTPRLVWLDPEVIHCVENTDTVQYHAIRVELKIG